MGEFLIFRARLLFAAFIDWWLWIGDTVPFDIQKDECANTEYGGDGYLDAVWPGDGVKSTKDYECDAG